MSRTCSTTWPILLMRNGKPYGRRIRPTRSASMIHLERCCPDGHRARPSRWQGSRPARRRKAPTFPRAAKTAYSGATTNRGLPMDKPKDSDPRDKDPRDKDVVRLERMGDVGLILVDHPPVNALSQTVRKGLIAALARLAADASLHAAVLACEGRTFIAGADIREF